MGSTTEGGMTRRSEWKKPVAAIFIHAGAGYHSTTNEKVHLQACNDAAKVAMRCLKSGGDATVAVEMAIKCLEDKEITNAGFGSNLNMDGTVECDATVVDHLGRSGACGAVPGIKNPISLAKIILDTSSQRLSLRRVPPNILIGYGAQMFAEQHGITAVPNDELVSKNARDRFERWYVDLQRAEARAKACQFPTNEGRADTPSGYEAAAAAAHPVPRHEHTAAILTATWNEGQPDSPYHSGSPSEYVSAQSSAAPSARGTPIPQPSPHTNQNQGMRSPLNLLPSATRASRSSSISKRARTQTRHTDEPAETTSSSPCSPPKKRTKTSEISPHDSGLSEDTQDQPLPPLPLSPSLHAKARAIKEKYEAAYMDERWKGEPPSPAFLAAEAARIPSPEPPCDCCTGPICRLQPVIDSCKYFQRRRDWEEPDQGEDQARDQRALDDQDIINDTVGAIAIDLQGHIAAGSSSGGIGMKHRGRVGPAALVGIGTAIIPADPGDEDDVSVAAVTSGTGEHMATTMASHKCAERLYHSTRRGPDGRDMTEDDEDAIMESFISADFMGHPGVRNQPSAGAIGVMAVKKTRGGYYFFFAHNTDSFALASQSSEERVPLCVMSRTPESNAVIRGGRKVRVD